MPMISYAQNHEDVLLNRLFGGRSEGFYIDAGANHPRLHSVTKHFSELGWRGVNIEPVASIHQMLVADRPRDVNLNVGVSDHEGTLSFFEAVTSFGMSTFATGNAKQLVIDGYPCVERVAPVTTLASICARHAHETIDFLKIDVENHETEAVRGADFRRWRPRVVLVEATDRPERWEHFLLESGYQFACHDGLNRFYVRDEDRDLLPRLATPVNVLDDFVPDEHDQLVRDLRWTLGNVEEELRREKAEISGLKGVLRAECERLALELNAFARALNQARAGCDERDALIHRLECELEATRARLAPYEGIGPAALGIARKVQGAARRFPKAAASVRKMARRAG